MDRSRHGRRAFLREVGRLGAAGLLTNFSRSGPSASAGSKKRPPNIVHILIDDMGFSDLGCYGGEFCETPRINRLAAQGMRFTNGYAAAPICSASRAAFLTGRSPARLGFEFVTKWPETDYRDGWAERYADKELVPPVYTLDLALEEVSVAEALQSAGYVTGITGKWHVSAHHERYNGWSPTHGPKQQGFDWGAETFGSHPYSYTEAEKGTFGPYEEGHFARDELTDKAIEFIREHRHEPFFLFVSPYYVHVPLGTKCRWLLDKYRAKAGGKYDERRVLYGAFVETLDHYVGQVLDALDEAGIADNTLVVFTSDNGGHPEFAFHAPLRGSKWNLYEGGVRVPWIVRWPGVVAAGSVCDAPVVGMDFMPTYCDVAGVTGGTTADLDGMSAVPILRHGAVDSFKRRTICWHFPYYHPESGFDTCQPTIGIEDGCVSQTRPQSSIRHGDYKLIYFFETEGYELYDLAEDIGEQHNLAAEQPDVGAQLKERLFDYLGSVHARLPQRKTEAGAIR
ncbi:MAG TPA: sulfatase [Candidatus Hydrogenedentes bacterium]|nr:sulfatase [Candidatus Hydrogenedentota bacterium]HPG65705.1 sulfatase [Candidatus Hydrogenedentota bacterium]